MEKNSGNSNRITRKYMDSLLIETRYMNSACPDLTMQLYGRKFSSPIMTAALSHLDHFMFEGATKAYAEGAAQADVILWLGMPIVSRPVTIGKYTLLDGGIVCPVPFRYMEKKGYQRNVIILTQPDGYTKKKSPAVFRDMLKRYPAIARAMERRHMVYNRQMEQIREREQAGKVLVIRPPEDLGIGRTEKNPDELERVYQAGRKEAERQLKSVMEFLGFCTV